MMDLREYQERALKTDVIPGSGDTPIVVPLLGLAGEVGELVSEYKKQLRDGEANLQFKQRVVEELGDILWYLSNVASKFSLDLTAVAESNLRKCGDRWGYRAKGKEAHAAQFDLEYPERERLPRQFEFTVSTIAEHGKIKMRAFVSGVKFGSDLTDNAYSEDGYRYHDLFHVSNAAFLNWSPVLRDVLNCKRKSNPLVDEVEDGGRAAAIEEGISAMVFAYAKDHALLEGVTVLDYELLRTIKTMTSHLEVARCTAGEWENAILKGYAIWREVSRRGSGTISVDLDARSLTYRER